MAILTYPLNGILYDAEDVETYLCTRTSGVFASDGHFPASVTGSREITIGPGLAWMQNEEFHGKAIYNPESEALTIAEADAYQTRIDRIVLQFDKLMNQTKLVVKQGEPATNPKPPEIERDVYIYELGLYAVNVKNSSISVSASDISCTFLDESVCGIMEDAVTGIPTQELYDQWYAFFEEAVADTEAFENQFEIWFQLIKDEAEEYMKENEQEFENWRDEQKKDFDDWFDNLEYVLDGDVAGKLEVEIENAQDTADTAMEQLATGWVEGYMTDEADGSEYVLLADDNDENYGISLSRLICNCDDMNGDASKELISDEFSTKKSYSAGDYCIYGNILYQFTKSHSGDWDFSDVTATNVSTELQNREAEIESVSKDVTNLSDSLSSLLSVQSFNSSTFSLSGSGSSATYAIDVSLSGYTPLGIVGVRQRNASNGSGCSWMDVYAHYLSGTTVSVRVIQRQSAGTVTNVYVQVYVLFIKNTTSNTASPQGMPDDDDDDSRVAPGPEIIDPDDDGNDNPDDTGDDDDTKTAPGPETIE